MKIPFWAVADLVTQTAVTNDFQVSLEDIVPGTGTLVSGSLSQYSAEGTTFEKGDVLFGKLRPYLAKYWLADREGVAGGDIHVYRPRKGVDSRYLAYIVGSRNFIRYAVAASKGVKMPRIEWMSLRQYGVNRYDERTQHEIADYLDCEIGEIDAMLAKLEALDESLNLRRASVVEWETIARSRGVTRLKFCADISLGKTFQGVRKSDHETLVNYVRAASIQSHGLELDDQRMWMTREEQRKYDLKKGDVLVVEGGAGFGRSVYLAQDMPGWGFQNHVIRARPDQHHDGRFLNYCVKGHYSSGLIGLLADGATIPGLSSDKAKNLPIPDMSLEEQQRIADHLDEVTGRIDAMLATIDELKALLVERRAALITDVVTGRKKVPA
ncbi:restriction endonuclease subunit S [Actinomyces bouchesdurhonensis]|jgi:type I restriction-modification system, specificity subunit|uniref:restriction endonuclease subunit S n=1 Tax=Actinomyces bouchesdurhonensis TaxID=1852361 RepID=UPI00093A9146|nr:restriction endonuclease subunit S [Actinomyces bouchesdurhonensis]